MSPAVVTIVYRTIEAIVKIRIAAMDSTMRFMLENGMIEQEVDIASLVIR
jgi:hypothetical protein